MLYVLGILNNLLSIFTLARTSPIVKFMDDKCTYHNLSCGDSIVTSGLLCCELYKLNSYCKCVEDLAYVIMNTKDILDAKLWHAHSVYLNFASLLCLQKYDMVFWLPKLEAPSKYVCEGFILGKMQHFPFLEMVWWGGLIRN